MAAMQQGKLDLLTGLGNGYDLSKAGENPVLIGGGVSSQEELLIRPLREKVLSTLMPRFSEGLLVESATLANDAGLIGAAKFFMDCNAAN